MRLVCEKDICTGCNACVNVCHKNAVTIVDTYKEFKYMFAYDFYKIIQPTPLQTSGFTAFYEKRCLYNSFVYAPFRIVNDKVLEEVKYYDTDKLKELVLDTARYLSICSKFSYINPEIIVR